MGHRVAPASHPSAVPTGQSPSCPGVGSFGIADDPLHRLPCLTNLPVPVDGSPSYLGSRTIRFAIRRAPGSPRTLSSGSAAGRINQGCPKSNVLRRSPIFRSSGSPKSRSLGCPSMLLRLPRFGIYGWIDDVPGWPRTLHPRLAPRMNLRIQSGVTLPARRSMHAPSLFGNPPAGEPADVSSNPNQLCISCQTETAVPMTYRVTS